MQIANYNINHNILLILSALIPITQVQQSSFDRELHCGMV